MIFQPKIDIFSVFYTMNLQFMVLIYTRFARQSLYTMNLQIHGPNLHVLRTAVTLYHEFTIHGLNLHVLRTAVTLYQEFTTSWS